MFRCAILIGLCAAGITHAQDIRIYSEFERFDPFGKPVAADRDLAPREILSPAMPRNGHLSVHVVVTAPAGTNYFLYTGTNPPDILEVRIYREYFTRCADGYCPDWLVEQNSPAFGAMPETLHNTDDPALDRQNTRCYLLDIRAPADTPPRRVRLEALLKVGTWFVAPMEVRIVAPTLPPRPADALQREDVAALSEPSSQTAHRQLLRYLDGLPPEWPVRMVRVRDFIQRNAAEDMLLAHSLAGPSGRVFPELNLLSWQPFVYGSSMGAEWYLKVKDFLYRF